MFWLAEVFNGRYSQEEVRRIENWARRQRAEAVRGLPSAIGQGLAALLRESGRAVRLSALGLANGYNRYRRRRLRRAAIRDLNALSDRTLKDIGLLRGDIRTVVDGMLDREQKSRVSLRSVESQPARQVQPTGDPASRDAGDRDWQRAA